VLFTSSFLALVTFEDEGSYSILKEIAKDYEIKTQYQGETLGWL
jgi:hypothetical protein